MNSLIRTAGFTMRSGIEIAEAVFLLLVWEWLNMSSIAIYFRQTLTTSSGARKYVMYDLIKPEEINCHELNGQTARAVYKQHKLTESRIKAFLITPKPQQA